MSDLIDRDKLIDFIMESDPEWCIKPIRPIFDYIKEMPSAQPEQRWIPVTERLPENTYPVNITWVNHKPVSYYANIKDKPFTATGCFCDGKWYWYSATCQDYLDEYRYYDVDSMDNEIEVTAWMPLPKPYERSE